MKLRFLAAFAALAISASAPAQAGSADKLRVGAPAGTERAGYGDTLSIVLYTGLAIAIVAAVLQIQSDDEEDRPASP